MVFRAAEGPHPPVNPQIPEVEAVLIMGEVHGEGEGKRIGVPPLEEKPGFSPVFADEEPEARVPEHPACGVEGEHVRDDLCGGPRCPAPRGMSQKKYRFHVF